MTQAKIPHQIIARQPHLPNITVGHDVAARLRQAARRPVNTGAPAWPEPQQGRSR
jgi:hypothetical protein